MDLKQLESLCQKVYGQNSTPEERKNAHHELIYLQTSAAYVGQCVYVLKESTDENTLMYACQSLSLIMKRDFGNISPQQKLSLQQLLLEKIPLRPARHFITKKFIQTVCILTRRAWCEDARMHILIDIATRWTQQGNPDLGISLLGELVTEFDNAKLNAAYGDESTRRTFQAFREQEGGLYRIFTTCVSLVWSSASRLPSAENVLLESLRCLLACLQFDFCGTGVGENETFGNPLVNQNVFLPKAWIPIVGSEKSISDMFDLYKMQFVSNNTSMLSEEIASLCLQCLVFIAGIRRTTSQHVMSQAESIRNGSLRAIMQGVEVLCQTQIGFLESEDCLHHFCRLLGRIKVSAQQLIADPDLSFYFESKWLLVLREFSTRCLCSWLTVGPHSIFYLFEFWRCVSHVLSENKQILNPLVVSYLETRMEMCEVVETRNTAKMQHVMQLAYDYRLAREGDTASCDLDEINPLKSEDTLLEEITTICSFVKEEAGEEAVLKFIGNQFLASPSQAKRAFSFYFTGCLIGLKDGGNLVQLPSELLLCAQAFQTVVRPSEEFKSIHLEFALLYFLQTFQHVLLESKTRMQLASHMRGNRRVQSTPPSPIDEDMPFLAPLQHQDDFYVTGISRLSELRRSSSSELMVPTQDQLVSEMYKTQSVSRQIAELAGLNMGGEDVMLNVTIRHVIQVLTRPQQDKAEETKLVERALSVLKQLTHSNAVVMTPFSAVPKMIKAGDLLLDLDFIQDLLQNPSPSRFPLLVGRSRTVYLSVIAYLFFVKLDSLVPSVDSNMLQSELVDDAFSTFMSGFTFPFEKLAMMHFFRDVRGVFLGANEFSQYELCFSWFFLPQRVNRFVGVVTSFWFDSEVMNVMLKLLVEVCSNRESRISFPVSSSGLSTLIADVTSIVLPFCRLLFEYVSKEILEEQSHFMELWRDNHVAQDLHKKNLMSMDALRSMVEEMVMEEETTSIRGAGVGMGFTIDHKADRMKVISQLCLLMNRLGKLSPVPLSSDLQVMVLNLALSTDPKHLASFPKCEINVIMFVYYVTETNPQELLKLSPATFSRLLTTLTLASKPRGPLFAGPIISQAAYSLESIGAMRARARLFSLSPVPLEMDVSYVLRPQVGFVPCALSLKHRIHNRMGNKTFTGRELAQSLEAFASFERNNPVQFGELFGILLERVLITPESELTNLFALTRPLISLACTTQQGLDRFMADFVNAQSLARKQAFAEQLKPIHQILSIHNSSIPEMCEVLRRQDEFSKSLCKSIRIYREFALNDG